MARSHLKVTGLCGAGVLMGRGILGVLCLAWVGMNIDLVA